MAFVGPGYLIAVGYMDPGNWATDIAGGSQFGYLLLSTVVISNFIAIFLQALSAKLGIVTGRDLAQACRDAYARPISVFLWLSAEVAIVACDLAEVIGAAIALNLLFHIPLVLGVLITAADVLLVLGLQHKGFRIIESLVIALIATMMAIFAIEVVLSQPHWREMLVGFIPQKELVSNRDALYIGLGILGATVMPHNLYLHSSIIQTRMYGHGHADLKDAIRLSYTDSSVALMLALFVNAAILVVAAATFHRAHPEVQGIQQAYQMLTPLLGAALATPLFAIALLASGQNSTITGTMAGQVILEGFTRWSVPPYLRRLISRLVAIVPCVFVVWHYGESGIDRLMLLSQVVLSGQLVFAIVPLVQFTSDRNKMGPFVNGAFTRTLGWSLAAMIFGLNAYLIYAQVMLGKG